MSKFRILFLLTFSTLIATDSLFSQNKQGNVWVFGKKGGLDFNTGTPQVFGPTGMYTTEGCSSMADENGNLLFYANGDRVYDRTHSIMANGDKLKGAGSAVQGVIITPYIDDNFKYYIFTADGNSFLHGKGLYAYTVDMRLNNCLGDVVPGSEQLLYSDTLSENVMAVKHSNNIDYWIIVKPKRNNNFRAFLVTSAGIDPTPVVSSFGNTIAGIYGNMYKFGSIGTLRASHDGTAIISTIYGSTSTLPPLGQTQFIGNIELFDFDATTGVLSNRQKVAKDTVGVAYMGAEFSPDNKLIYATLTINTSTTDTSRILRYERFAADIPLTETIIYDTTWAANSILRLGPDNKIYHTRYGRNYLGVINDPNSLNAPNYNSSQQALYDLSPGWSLPNNFNYDNYIIDLPKIDAGADTIICSSDFALLGGKDSLSGYTYNWSPSASLNNNTIFHPLANPSQSTQYILSASITCKTLTDTVMVTVLQAPKLIGADSICLGDSNTLSVINGTSYSWYDGSTDSSIIVAPLSSSYFSVSASNFLCTMNDSIWVQVDIPPSPVSINGKDSICIGDTVLLSVSGWDNYSWSSGENADTIIVWPSSNKTYTVIATSGACSSSDSILINIIPIQSLFTVSAQGLAPVKTDFINSSINGIAYSWDFGDSSFSKEINPTHTYDYPGKYTITLIAKNIIGCADTSEYETIILGETPFYIPNAFSPNGDGLNDVFAVSFSKEDFTKVDLSIYNRWGERIFNSSNGNPWDGLYNGSIAADGIYTWNLKIKSINGTESIKQGKLILLK